MRTLLVCSLALFVLHPKLCTAQGEYPYASKEAETPDWVMMMYGRSSDPGLIVTAYEEYYKTHPFVKNSNTQYYKRWIRELSRALPPLTKEKPRPHGRSVTSQWQCIGPWDWDHDAADRSYAPGAAHVYTVEQAPSDPNVLYAGTATAGVWKSLDRGASWTPLTYGFRSTQVTALEINSLRPNTVYTELMNSVYKSVDGGQHWAKTGSAAFQQLVLDIYDIAQHPEDTARIFVGTQNGLYRSVNGGTAWVSVLSGEIQEIEFHPTHPDTVYAVKKSGERTLFYRSINGGASFQEQTTGWPVPNTGAGEHQRRVEIAVSPDAPDNVYALATGLANGGSGLYGVYVSTDAGVNWNFQCCGPQPAGPPSSTNRNLMGWNELGLDDGGQYYYDLAFAVSPTNADSIFVCGINLWVSSDGGASFVCPASWSQSYKPGYVHADIHDIRITPATGEVWVACDGGIFRSLDAGITFSRRMTGIAGTDFWGFGSGFWDGEVMLGGTYHNGTLMKDNDVFVNGWVATDGGDNFRGFVNPGKPKQVYSDYNIKSLTGDRTTSSGTRPFEKKPNASYIIGRSSDVLFHPQYFGTWYTGSGTKLWYTEDDGYTFRQVYDFGVEIGSMAMAPGSPNVLYVCTWPDWWGVKRIYRSENAGETWLEITPSSAMINGNTWVPYDITVDAYDSRKIWIVRTSMYGDTNLNGYAVFASTDGGATWTNLSTPALNNEAFTCIMHQAGTNGGVYIGTRETVYYRNAQMDDWAWYGDGLPRATFATRLIPYYREGKLRSGTNRSVWESPLYEPSNPIAIPSVLTKRNDCVLDTVCFQDHSIVSENNVSWLWQFPGGTPSTSSARNPRVIYAEPGIYSATLTVSDANGSSTTTAYDIVEVRNICGLDTVPGKSLKLQSFPDYVVVPPLDVVTNTLTISSWVKPEGTQADYAPIVMSEGSACGMNFREGNNTLGYHWGGSGYAWSWDSNLEVPANQWSHVAMVVTPTSVRLYVNGVEAKHIIASSSQNIQAMKVGNYQGWQSRNFKGEIDELCIWNRALSQDEIRALRHLVKRPEDDPDLLLYYQFNEEKSLVYDKANAFDGVLNGNAKRTKSRAPIGSGVSASKTILLPGSYTFGSTGLTLTYGLGAIVPLGQVYATRLRAAPDTLVTGKVPYLNGYWVINNYGTLQNLSSPSSVSVDGIAFVSDPMRTTLSNEIYARGANEELGGWYMAGQGGTEQTGLIGQILYSAMQPNFTQLGQLVTVRDSMSYGRPQVVVLQEPDTTVVRRGGSSAAMSIQTSAKGLALPRYTTAQLEAIPSPVQGTVVFVSDMREVVCFDGAQWQKLTSCYLEPPTYQGLIETSGISLGGGSNAGAILSLGEAAGVLVLPVFNQSNITNIDFPKEGLVVYRSDLHALSFYDGVDWISMAHTTTDLGSSDAAPTTSLPGMRIGTGTKDPNALLHITDDVRGFALPVARCADVVGAQPGLIIFDGQSKSVMLFDGVGWKVVK